MPLPLSVLDLAPVPTGSTASEALQRTVELARLAEKLGYSRYWFAEHHGMPGVASSSPEILIGHVAAATERIRVGSGGIMLPNHVPLRVAENFHTLEALFPGRIDLGIGRAPGTDPITAQALRPFDAAKFSSHLAELLDLSRGSFDIDHPFHRVRVIPNDVDLPPIWLLGSSGASARLAGSLGLGYSFASHFSPASPTPALDAYRESFVPSKQFPEPHAIVAVAAVCAETEEHADYLSRTMDLAWVKLRTGFPGLLPSPEEALAYEYTPIEREAVMGYRSLHCIGTPRQVRAQIEALADECGASEIMISSMIHSHPDRLKSFELIASEFGIG